MLNPLMQLYIISVSLGLSVRLQFESCHHIFFRMVMTLCYDAISRNVSGLKYSPFVIFSLTSTTIFPACAFILLVQDRIGRKALASASLFLSGIATASSGLILATARSPDSGMIISLAIISR